MPALFPPWANTAARLVCEVVAAWLARALAAPMIRAPTPYATGFAAAVARQGT
jgi:hypothetical protein